MMDKEDEIRERLQIHKATDDSHYIDDVEYLLNEIERLKVLTCPACGERLQW